MNNIFIAIFALLAITGCATSGIKFTKLEEAEDGKSVIYVMRPWRIHRGAATLDVLINDEEVGKLANGGYLPIQVKPGSGAVTIAASSLAKFIGWTYDPMTIEYDILENENVFLILDSSTDYFIPLGYYHIAGVSIDFFELEEKQAMEVLPRLSLSR